MSADLIVRWLHIVGGIMLVGGTLFWRLALMPSLVEAPQEAALTVGAALRRRWSRLVMMSSGMLLVSGIVNLMLTLTRYKVPPAYHMVFGIKFLLALAVFLLAALLAGRTPVAERLRQNERFWLSLNAVLAIVVVCLGGVLKNADRESKSAQSFHHSTVPVAMAAVDG